MTYDYNKEIQEAIDAGEEALRSLYDAKKYLISAGNWGIVDILGGGLITDLIKHSKIQDASRCIDRARYDLRRFSKELDDIDEYISDVNVGDFLTFADFFFDGFIADIFMQNKISDAKNQVDQAINRVNTIISRLRQYLL